MLHKQALLMSNKILIKGAHNEDFVPSLCHDLRDTLLRFLAENNLPTTKDNGCSTSFNDVFLSSLQLRGQIILKQQLCRFTIIWPRAGDRLNLKTMMTNLYSRKPNDLEGERTVVLPLLPGLLMHTGFYRERIVHARVIASRSIGRSH